MFTSLQNPLALASRLLLAALFLPAGISKITGFAGTVGYITSVGLPMPTVAVVQGWCIGGGLAIASTCDFRIATPASKFGVPIARTCNCMPICR